MARLESQNLAWGHREPQMVHEQQQLGATIVCPGLTVAGWGAHQVGGWRMWALDPGLGLGLEVARALTETHAELPSVSLDAHPGGQSGLAGSRKEKGRPLVSPSPDGGAGCASVLQGQPCVPQFVSQVGSELCGGIGVQGLSLGREGPSALWGVGSLVCVLLVMEFVHS